MSKSHLEEKDTLKYLELLNSQKDKKGGGE